MPSKRTAHPAKQRTFLVTWKTSTDRFWVVKGATIAEACEAAGIGGGAIAAIDVWSDITPLANSPRMQETLRAIGTHGDRGYFWHREYCAKLARIYGCLVEFVDPATAEASRPTRGWKLGEAGVFLAKHFTPTTPEHGHG